MRIDTTTAMCDSRGPRIGSEGTPRCRLPIGHSGAHRPAYEDGWGHTMTWSDPGERRSTELSTEEAAVVQRFEAGADAEESLRERVAVSIWNTTMRDEMTADDWCKALALEDREFYRDQADAAIAVMRGDS